MKIFTLVLALLIAGCSSKYTLKFATELSTTRVLFKQSPQQISQFIRSIEVKDPLLAEHWEVKSTEVSHDTTYFKVLNTFETELRELGGDKRFTLNSENHLDIRVVSSYGGTVVEAIRATHSNNAIPFGYYEADVGRDVAGRIDAVRDEVRSPEGIFKDFVILLDKTIDKHGNTP